MSALMHDNLLEKLLLEFQLLCFFLSVCFCLIHVRCSMSILISIFSVNSLFCTKCGSDYFVCMFGIDHVHNTFRQFFCCTHSMAVSFSISYFHLTNQTVCAAHAQPNIDNKKKNIYVSLLILHARKLYAQHKTFCSLITIEAAIWVVLSAASCISFSCALDWKLNYNFVLCAASSFSC